MEKKKFEFFVMYIALRTCALCADGTDIFTHFVASHALINWLGGVGRGVNL